MVRHRRAERDVVREVLLAVGSLPSVRCWRNNTGTLVVQDRRVAFGLRGSSDVLGVVGPSGRLLAIECKSDRGRMTSHQRAFAEMVVRFGGLHVVARSAADALDALASAGVAGAAAARASRLDVYERLRDAGPPRAQPG